MGEMSMPLWMVRLETLGREDASALDEALDAVVAELDNDARARGPVVEADVGRGWLSARYFVAASGIAEALAEAVGIFQEALDRAGLGRLPIVRAEVSAEDRQAVRPSRMRIGAASLRS
jgi:hypothetical protein